MDEDHIEAQRNDDLCDTTWKNNQIPIECPQGASHRAARATKR